MKMKDDTRVPVTILTGFLGSGKTTVLRHLLTSSGQRLAVMVNEFGSVGLDGDLIRSCGFCPEDELDGRLVELNNGCLCCTVQDDFLPTMQRLLERADTLDGIVVETSGLALPAPLLQALEWPEIRSRVHVNGVVTLTDGEALVAGSPVGDNVVSHIWECNLSRTTPKYNLLRGILRRPRHSTSWVGQTSTRPRRRRPPS